MTPSSVSLIMVRNRSMIDICLVWDIRKLKTPLASRSDLPTLYPDTNAIFSPDDKYIVTGSSATSKGGKGRLLFLSKETLDVVKSLEIEATPVKVVWHPKINQVRKTVIYRA